MGQLEFHTWLLLMMGCTIENQLRSPLEVLPAIMASKCAMRVAMSSHCLLLSCLTHGQSRNASLNASFCGRSFRSMCWSPSANLTQYGLWCQGSCFQWCDWWHQGNDEIESEGGNGAGELKGDCVALDETSCLMHETSYSQGTDEHQWNMLRVLGKVAIA